MPGPMTAVFNLSTMAGMVSQGKSGVQEVTEVAITIQKRLLR
jgi:hypothetical protein